MKVLKNLRQLDDITKMDILVLFILVYWTFWAIVL